MALSKADLANKILQAISQKVDGHGVPISAPTQMQEYASGIIDVLTTGTVTFAPGTITGTAPPSGGPLTGGAGSGGLMTLSPAPLIAKNLTANPQGVLASPENTAMVTYIMSSGAVSFGIGNVTGTCTNTSSSPGTFTGVGSNGKISGLSGAACAVAVAAAGGPTGPDSVKVYTAIMNYIMDNATVSASVLTGSASAGGGPIIAAGGTGGTIS